MDGGLPAGDPPSAAFCPFEPRLCGCTTKAQRAQRPNASIYQGVNKTKCQTGNDLFRPRLSCLSL